MRKKMYKKGKFWVVATIAAVATVVGAETVKADEEMNTNSSASASVSTENTSVATKSTDNAPSQASVVSASASTNRAVTSSATTDSLTTSVPSTEPSDSSVSTTTSSTLDNKVVVKEDNRASAVPATSNEEQPSSSVAEEPHRAATGGSASDSSEQTSPSATIHIENIDNKTGSYDVVISNVVAPKGMNGIVVPTWTDNNGQDDIIWGNATKQADGSYRYTVKSDEHKGEGGLYNSHVYIVEKDGHFAWGGGKQVTLNLPKASATVSIENVNNTAGTYDVVISNLVTPKGVQRIVVPTWTDNKGQDDIIWNDAIKQTDGTYRLTIKASDHKGEGGLYNSHVYIVEKDGHFAWGGGKQVILNLPKASATVSIENVNNTAGTYDVVISNLVTPKGVQRIVVPTWTDNKGQDDIIWNDAIKQTDGTYRLTIKASDHKGEGGLYNSHVYIVEKDGHFAWGGGKQVILNLPKASATVSIENVNNTAGTYDVVISNLVTPKGVQRIVVPTWTDNNGQDDIIWNNAVKQTDGTYRLTIKASDHRWESGKYHSHVYIVENNGNFAWGGGVTATLNIPRSSIKSVITPTYKGTGGYDVRIDFAPEQGEVLFAVWSEKNGQDDLIWYSAKHANDGSYQSFFNAQNHKDTGVYNIHAYQKLNGQMNFLAATTIDVAQSTYSAPYYSQRDARWGGTVYGVGNMHDTGCVPTTLAMAISAIKEKAVLPTEIADYLYHNTDTFNKRFAGSSGKAIALASQHWGLSSTVLSLEDDISRALADGHYVTAAVGGGSFTSGFVTHEILLKGNVDGKTYVLDPYTPSNNRWFPISYISSIRSTDKDDNSEGAPFFKITDI